jgi:NAD-dependent DNA ligase
MATQVNPLPPNQPYSSRVPGQPVCRQCKSAYGSKYDGICTKCRGMDAFTAQRKEQAQNFVNKKFTRWMTTP